MCFIVEIHFAVGGRSLALAQQYSISRRPEAAPPATPAPAAASLSMGPARTRALEAVGLIFISAPPMCVFKIRRPMPLVTLVAGTSAGRFRRRRPGRECALERPRQGIAFDAAGNILHCGFPGQSHPPRQPVGIMTTSRAMAP